ncbi:MAG: 4-hydroxythreonine-4-phosphate dehydrogenase PdxA [Nannocystaceae bacterium]
MPRTLASSAPAGSSRRLVITQGDPEGIGPELLLRLGDAGLVHPGDLVIADRSHLVALVDRLGKAWARRGLEALVEHLIEDAPGLTQVQALTRAVDRLQAGVDDEWDPRRHDPAGRRADLHHALPGLVTAPIDKARCAAEGFAFPGHTEYLAHRAGAHWVAMLMVGPRLRVVPATIHVPLREVPKILSAERIFNTGRLLAEALHHLFGIASPRVGVLGLNPHAGEKGLLGDEEATLIAPAIAELQSWARTSGEPALFFGPLAADTAFPLHAAGHYDGLVAMYHDQGLGPFKLMHMHDGVNLTLGLPFVRTSPDHGTARDIAGLGVADPSSMFEAVALARRLGIPAATLS